MFTASIVVHVSPLSELVEVVGALRKARLQKIWIVYNGPKDKSHLYRSIPGIEFIETDNNGFGAGHNIALRKAIDADCQYHLILNSDIHWEGDIFSPLIDALQADPSIGIIAPEVKNPDGSLQYSCRMLPSPFNLFSRRFLPKKMYGKSDSKFLLKNLDHSKPINAPYLLGCFMIFRIEALRQVGLFDERFFMYPEDMDITRRIHRNWKTLYYPSVSIIHEHKRQSRHSVKMLFIHIVNIIRYFNKWGWIHDDERKMFNKLLVSEK